MKKQNLGLGVAFLDVLSCALGGAVLLSVIFLIVKEPPSTPKVGEFIFLHAETTDAFEVGFEVWTPAGKSLHFFSNSPGMDPGNEAKGAAFWSTGLDASGKRHVFSRIEAPQKGLWRVIPYAVTQEGTPQWKANLVLAGFSWRTKLKSAVSTAPEPSQTLGSASSHAHFFSSEDAARIEGQIPID